MSLLGLAGWPLRGAGLPRGPGPGFRAIGLGRYKGPVFRPRAVVSAGEGGSMGSMGVNLRDPAHFCRKRPQSHGRTVGEEEGKRGGRGQLPAARGASALERPAGRSPAGAGAGAENHRAVEACK
jgi:hypothetical protein